MMKVDGYAMPEKVRNVFLGFEEKEKTLINYFTQHNEQYAKRIGAKCCISQLIIIIVSPI